MIRLKHGDLYIAIDENFQTDGHTVWVYKKSNGNLQLLKLVASTPRPNWRWEPITEDEASNLREAKPATMILPRGVLEALTLAFAGERPDSEAQASHLLDTREVRDRVLTLVEQMISKGG